MTVYIPKTQSTLVAAWPLVHEATHVRQQGKNLTGLQGEYEAFTNECKWLIQTPELMKILPPNYNYYIKDTKTQKAWITETEKGKYKINEDVIKKWVDNPYGGYYKPDPLIEYKRDKTGRYIYEFGEKKLLIEWMPPK